MFNIGIIGCGKIAQVRHIPEYAENPDARLWGYYDLNQERAKELAEKYGGRVYGSYEELLEDKDIDAVSVCAANHVHAEITVAALKAGKHVLCEKPMAMELSQCEAMAEAARETGKFLMIGHNQRLVKAHAEAKKLIESGLIGRIITFKTNFAHGGPETWSIDPGKNVWFFDKTRAVMGAMADLGIHKTDLIQYLTGSKISEVTAYLGTLDKKDGEGNFISVDDNAICIYKLENGTVGTMTASWTCCGKEDNSTVLYGTEGVMKIYADPLHSIVVEGRDRTVTYYDTDQIQTNENQTRSGVIDVFMKCLTTNTPPQISGEEALAAMKAVFAAVESSETGKTVKIS
ncbi:MAG: Gfo/Idh/MocA family oxidoreductase [Lacrimispora sp.]|uniref:Gfo/Idh/MocA family protein n=1 Tax=Lacrimispora sp. TaxID=2719234 RepID=UPI0039E2A4C4